MNDLIPIARDPGNPLLYSPCTVPPGYKYQHLQLVSLETAEPLWDETEGRKIVRPTIHLFSEERCGFLMRPDLKYRMVLGFHEFPIVMTPKEELYLVADPDEHIARAWASCFDPSLLSEMQTPESRKPYEDEETHNIIQLSPAF